MPLQGCGIAEGEKIGAPALLCRTVRVVAEEMVQERFAQTGQLFEPAPMPRIGDRQPEKLERS